MWSREEIEFLKYNDTTPIKELAELLDRTELSVHRKRTALRITGGFKIPWKDDEKDTVKQNPMLSNEELATLLNRTPAHIANMRKFFGLKYIKICIMCGSEFVRKYSSHKACTICNPDNVKSKNNPMARYRHYREGANSRNLSFDISPREFYSFWDKPCEYCGGDIEGIGLDRIDSSKGYHAGNVIPCCKTCNVMKMDSSVEDWVVNMKKTLKFMGEI